LIGYCGLAALLLAGAPVVAQGNSSTAAPSSSAPASDIGPRELSNFSLNGTVTRQAEPQTQPAAQPPEPVVERPANSQPVDRSATTAERPAQARVVEQRPTQARSNGALGQLPTQVTPVPPVKAQAAPAPAPAAPIAESLPEQSSGFSPLPWIIALLLLAAGAAVYFGLQRRNVRYQLADGADDFEAVPELHPEPAPAPLPRQAADEPLVRRAAPEPTGAITSSLRPVPPAAVGGGITSSLRPWIDLELEPSQAMLTDDHAAIAFDVTIINSGSAPARDVAVEACMINAGDQQDAQLGEFYMAPSTVRDKIPAVAPMGRVTLKSAVRLPRSSVREYEVEGRKLFMPMVAINSRYRWSSGEGQSGASFLVGGRAANDSEKLSPLRLDKGQRGWKALAARRYEKGIRS